MRDLVLVVIIVVLIAVAVAGCANGVQMTDEETVRCRTDGCAAFTLGELRTLAGKAFKDGYLRGWSDSTRQAGRAL